MTLKTFLPLTVVALTATLMSGCSGCGGDATTDDPAAGASGTDQAGGTGAANGTTGADGSNASGGAAATGTGSDAASMTTVDPWNRTNETPQAEREGTEQNLEGLRATLMAELEAVRARLKDGSRTAEEKKADQTRASELSQGLERLERTIKGVKDATDVTWAQVRESELNAAREFREWMAKYGMNVGV